MAAIEAVMLGYLISSRPSKCVNFFGQTVHTFQHIGYVIAQILTTADVTAQILTGSDITAQILTTADTAHILTGWHITAQILTTADITAQILTVDKNNLKISQNVGNHKTKLKILSECAQ